MVVKRGGEDPPGKLSESSSNEYEIYTIADSNDNSRSNSFLGKIFVKDVPLVMVIDTGEAISVLANSVYFENFQTCFPCLRQW